MRLEWKATAGTIVMEGDDNVVSIATSVVSSGFNFQVRGGSRIHIGPRCHLGQLFVWADAGSTLSIGDSVGFNGIVRLQMHEPGKITIGNGCLFASEVEMTISDMHSIIDVGSGRRINPAQDITLGERVWVGQRAMILKGVAIGFGAVVGAAAIVTPAGAAELRRRRQSGAHRPLRDELEFSSPPDRAARRTGLIPDVAGACRRALLRAMSAVPCRDLRAATFTKPR